MSERVYENGKGLEKELEKQNEEIPAREPDRKLTVYGIWANNLYGRRNAMLPLIRLQGKWLQRLGFEAGSKFIVEEALGRLTITLIVEGQQENPKS